MAIGLRPRFAMALSVCGKSLTSGHASSMNTWACMSIVRTRRPPTVICRRDAAGACAWSAKASAGRTERANAHEQNARPVDLMNPRRLDFMPRMVSLRNVGDGLDDDVGTEQVDLVIGVVDDDLPALR